MSGAAKALQGAIDLLTKFYETPSLATPAALPLIDELTPTLRVGLDQAEYTENGLAEWRSEAIKAQREVKTANATARIAISHLQAVLNKSRTFDDQQRSDTAARDWLTSIGSEPN